MKKGDVRSCSNFRGIKVVSHTMKIWERVVEAMIGEQQPHAEKEQYM